VAKVARPAASEMKILKTALEQALQARGYEQLTPVQQAVTAPELENSDLLVSAQTGSGKTVGFGLAMAPTLLGDAETLDRATLPLALVIAPTRELALQVKRELGWLYADEGNRPPHVIPANSSPLFEGLEEGRYSNSMRQDGQTLTIPVQRGCQPWAPQTTAFTVPEPDPGEAFNDMNCQLFGNAQATGQATMQGFLANYATRAGAARAGQIMQTYSPEQVPLINQLARQFAVCDHWFASVPCQTWPNRGFAHTGSSDGHINNDHFEPYDIDTIFNVMLDQGISWEVYHDTSYTPSLTHIQFPRLWPHLQHFHFFERFEQRCAAGADSTEKLPAYSFVEPRFGPEWTPFKVHYPSDYHPPHDVARGEQFLARVYNTVRNSPYRDRILLLVTFDEHGGCYDHVPPPEGAVAPEPGARSRHEDFAFQRFGVRVPAIVVSSFVQAGTVFRSATATPYDHTSILATLRDWQQMDRHPRRAFLPSPRIAAAPTLAPVLTLPAEQARDWPALEGGREPMSDDECLSHTLNEIQLSQLVAHICRHRGETFDHHAFKHWRSRLKTYGDALDFFQS